MVRGLRRLVLLVDPRQAVRAKDEEVTTDDRQGAEEQTSVATRVSEQGERENEGTRVSAVLEEMNAEVLAKDGERAKRYIATVRPPMAGARLVRATARVRGEGDERTLKDEGEAGQSGEGASMSTADGRATAVEKVESADDVVVRRRAERRQKHREVKRAQVRRAKASRQTRALAQEEEL